MILTPRAGGTRRAGPRPRDAGWALIVGVPGT
jgi:hypothetical protein